jgi:hypothetical protein
MKTAIFNYIGNIRVKPYVKVECIHRGGRKYNYDFTFIFYDEDGTQETFNIELKFNVSVLDNAPQFVSPMNPSQYLNSCYEEFYYDNYMERLSVEAGLPIPSKEEYLKIRNEIFNSYQSLQQSLEKFNKYQCKFSVTTYFIPNKF